MNIEFGDLRMKVKNIYEQILKRKKYIYLVTILLLVFTQLITITVLANMWKFNKLFKLVRYICYIILALLAGENYYRKVLDNTLKGLLKKSFFYFKKHIVLMLFIVVAFLSTLVSKETIPLIILLIIVNAAENDFDETLSLIIKLNIIVFCITLLGGLTGILPDVIIYRGSTVRHSYGYIYPTELLSHYCFIVLMYIYLKQEKFSGKDFIIINVINVILFKMTDSRLDFLIIIIASCLALLFAYKPDILKRCVKPLYINVIFLLSIAFSFITAIFYNGNSTIFSLLNHLLSQRLLLGNNALSYYGLSVFGEKIKWIGSGGNGVYASYDPLEYNFVDCSYLQYTLSFGMMFMIAICVLYMLTVIYEYRKKNVYSLIVLGLVFVISIIEPRLINIPLNPFILLMGSVVMLSNKEILKLIKGERKNGTV